MRLLELLEAINKGSEIEIEVRNLELEIGNIQFTVSIDRPNDDKFDNLVKEFETAGFVCEKSNLKTTVYLYHVDLDHEKSRDKIIEIVSNNLKEYEEDKGIKGSASITDIIGENSYDICAKE